MLSVLTFNDSKKPNAGLPEMHDGRTVYGMGEEEFAEDTAELVKMGGYNLRRMLWDNAKIYKKRL